MNGRQALGRARRVVVKVGSGLVTAAGHGPDARRIGALAEDIAALVRDRREVTLVSSGAIATGMAQLGLANRPRSIPEKQAAAAVGQSALMWHYEQAFGKHGLTVGQVLLTGQDISDRSRYLNARNTLLTLLHLGVVPVVNENDTVAVEEIKVGDNDNLAALVAHLIDADLVVLLTDVEGLYTGDPAARSRGPAARHRRGGDRGPPAPRVRGQHRRLRRGHGDQARGRAKTAASGIPLVIASGEEPRVLHAAAPRRGPRDPLPAARGPAQRAQAVDRLRGAARRVGSPLTRGRRGP